MRPRRTPTTATSRERTRRAWIALFAAALAIAGCSAPKLSNPFGSGVNAAYVGQPPARTVLVLGAFENPRTSPLKWSDIGSGAAQQLGREMLPDKRFEVRFNEALASRVASLARGRTGELVSELTDARRLYPDVDYVIVGQVTDFHHTADLAGGPIEKGLFGPKNQAVTAISFTIVDLRTGRIAGSDHVAGTASAGGKPISQQYAGMSFGSYLFNRSPLGEATRHAVKKAAERLAALAPSQVASVNVIRVTGWRELSLAGGSDHGLAKGQRFYVCTTDAATGRLRPVYDRATGAPLQAQVTETSRGASKAWLVGEPAPTVTLSEAVLMRDLPPSEAVAGVR